MVGAGRFERPTPCAQGIGCPHLGINRFNHLRTLLVGPCGNFSYNLDGKAAIRLVKPPTTPTGSPAGSADCEINQRGRAYVVTAGSLEGPSIAGFKLGDPPAFAAGGRSAKREAKTPLLLTKDTRECLVFALPRSRSSPTARVGRCRQALPAPSRYPRAL